MLKQNEKRPTILLFLIFLSPLAGHAAPWAPDSDPSSIDRNYNFTFHELPKKAEISGVELPWSGPYWADRKGSIAFRWQTKERPWDYSTLSKEAVAKLKPSEIALLSPAEKFDILRGYYDFPLLTEVRKLAKRNQHAWYGICTGWAQAALHFNQPNPITLKNADDILVPFGSGDIKALASYYYAYPGDGDRITAHMGSRCDRGDDKRDCRRDVNAGALHILLANRIGLENKGLFADMNRGTQVWQQPIYGYETRYLGERAPQKDASVFAVREVHVKTRLFFTKEKRATWELDTLRERIRRLDYWLEIDGSGQIVGGSYESGRVPDYFWVSEPLTFEHGYELLNKMIAPKVFKGAYLESIESP